jgi:penicillin-binding protein 1A
MLETVLQYGTGRAAAIGQFAAGKTGTTSNYGDAWFVGWDSKYTVAVWVGYPTKLVPMTTDFNGQPVLGGTFPALIWHDFMTSALQVDKGRAEHAALNNKGAHEAGEVTAPTGSEGTAPPPSPSGKGSAPVPSAKGKATTPGAAGGEGGGAAEGKGSEHAAAPATPPAAASPAPETPAPPAATPPSSSGTGGVGPSG